MKNLIVTLTVLFLLPQMGAAQSKMDSIPGTYTRYSSTGSPPVHIDYGNGQSAEVSGYLTSSTSETLLLEKNHCAALTTLRNEGAIDPNFPWIYSNPSIYYGIWRLVGDTIIITYSITCCSPVFFTSDSYATANVKLNTPIQRKYLLIDGPYGARSRLSPINKEDYGYFDNADLM